MNCNFYAIYFSANLLLTVLMTKKVAKTSMKGTFLVEKLLDLRGSNQKQNHITIVILYVCYILYISWYRFICFDNIYEFVVVLSFFIKVKVTCRIVKSMLPLQNKILKNIDLPTFITK